MVVGFLGTVIALERATALRRSWANWSPALIGVGAAALLTPAAPVVGIMLVTAGFAVLVLVQVALWRRSREPTLLVQILATVLATGAAALLSQLDIAALVPMLVAFLVLTIAAERAELARVQMPSSAPAQLLGLGSALSIAVLASLLWPATGSHAVGICLLALVAWLVRHDVAGALARSTGLPRYSSIALLAGYGWLTVAGVLWAVRGAPTSVAAYDIVVHATFLGFAMSMVMAHAPIILPAVLGVRLPYRPVLWAPLGLLHTGLIVRLGAAVTGPVAVWQAGSVLTVFAVLLFVGTALTLVVTA